MEHNNWSEEVVAKLEKDWNKPDRLEAIKTFQLAEIYGDTFLDIGCGYGRFYDYLMQERIGKIFGYVGLDSAKAMIGKAKGDHPTSIGSFIEQDIEKEFKFSTNVILCNEVLVHIPLDRQIKILENINNCRFKYAVLTIESNADKSTSVRVMNLKGQSFYVVVQNEATFEDNIRYYIGDVTSIKKQRFHLIGDISKVVFMVKRG